MPFHQPATAKELVAELALPRTVVLVRGNVSDLHENPAGGLVPLDKLLADLDAPSGRRCIAYSPAAGAQQLTPPGSSPVPFRCPSPDADPTDALAAMLDGVRESSEPLTLILEWVEGLLPTPQHQANLWIEMLGRAALDRTLFRSGHRIIIVCRRDDVATALTQLDGVHELWVPLPDLAARRAMFDRLDGRESSRFAANPVDLADQTAGLTLRQIRQRCNEVESTCRSVELGDFSELKARSIEEMCDGALLLHEPSTPISEVAGLHNIRWIVEAHLAAGTLPPNLLLVGPPGTGKSHAPPCIAASLGWNIASWGEVMSQWVGSSEQRLRTLFRILEQLCPIVLHIDEIDQIIGQPPSPNVTQGDSGVSQRVRGMLQEWINRIREPERELPIMVVGTSNRPANLGAAMSDRFVELPVLHPDVGAATGIVTGVACSLGYEVDSGEVRALLGAIPADLNARTLTLLVREAIVRQAIDAGSAERELRTERLAAALDDLLELDVTAEEEEMSLEALARVEWRHALPWVAAHRLGAEYVPPRHIRPFVTEHGLDRQAVLSRLAELGGSGR